MQRNQQFENIDEALDSTKQLLLNNGKFDDIQSNIALIVSCLEECGEFLANPSVIPNAVNPLTNLPEEHQYKLVGLIIYLRNIASKRQKYDELYAKVSNLLLHIVNHRTSIQYYMKVIKDYASFYEKYSTNIECCIQDGYLSLLQKMKLCVLEWIAQKAKGKALNFGYLVAIIKSTMGTPNMIKQQIDSYAQFINDPIWKILHETGVISPRDLVEIGRILPTSIHISLPISILEDIIKTFFKPFIPSPNEREEKEDIVVLRDMLTALLERMNKKYQENKADIYFFLLEVSSKIIPNFQLRKFWLHHHFINVTKCLLELKGFTQAQAKDIIDKTKSHSKTIEDDFYFLIGALISSNKKGKDDSIYSLDVNIVKYLDFTKIEKSLITENRKTQPSVLVVNYVLSYINHQIKKSGEVDKDVIFYFFNECFPSLDIKVPCLPSIFQFLLDVPFRLNGRKHDLYKKEQLSLDAWFTLISRLDSFSDKFGELLSPDVLELNENQTYHQQIINSIKERFKFILKYPAGNVGRKSLKSFRIATEKKKFNALLACIVNQFNKILFIEFNTNSVGDQTVSDGQMDSMIKNYAGETNWKIPNDVCYFDAVLCGIVTSIMKSNLEKDSTMLLSPSSFRVLEIYTHYQSLVEQPHLEDVFNQIRENCEFIMEKITDIVDTLGEQSKCFVDRVICNQGDLLLMISFFNLTIHLELAISNYHQMHDNYCKISENIKKMVEFLSDPPFNTLFPANILSIDVEKDPLCIIDQKIEIARLEIREKVFQHIEGNDNEEKCFFFVTEGSELFKLIAVDRKESHEKEEIGEIIKYAVTNTEETMINYVLGNRNISLKDLSKFTISLVESRSLDSEMLLVEKFIRQFHADLLPENMVEIKEQLETSFLCAKKLLKVREVFLSLSKFPTIEENSTRELCRLLHDDETPVILLMQKIQKEIGGLTAEEFEYFANAYEIQNNVLFKSLEYTREEQFRKDLEQAKSNSLSWKNQYGLHLLRNLEMVYHLIQPSLPPEDGREKKTLLEICEQVKTQLDKCGNFSISAKLNSFNEVIAGQCSLITFFSSNATMENLDFFVSQCKYLLENGYFRSRVAQHPKGNSLIFFTSNNIYGKPEKLVNFPEIIQALRVFTGPEGSERIKVLVETYPLVKVIHELRLQMEELGRYEYTPLELNIKLKDNALFTEDIAKIKSDIAEWKQLLRDAYTDPVGSDSASRIYFLDRNQLSRCIAQLQAIYLRTTPDTSVVYSVVPYLWCCFPDYNISIEAVGAFFKQKLGWLRNKFEKYDGRPQFYLDILQHMIDGITEYILANNICPRTFSITSERDQPLGIVVPEKGGHRGFECAVMTYINSVVGYLPSPSQLLMCQENQDLNEENLTQFLRRAKKFPKVPFHIVNVDTLQSSLKERLKHLINKTFCQSSTTGVTLANLTLYFSSSSCAGEFSYIGVHLETAIILTSLVINKPKNIGTICYLNSSSGSGKSHKIKKLIRKSLVKPNRMALRFCLHEGFTPGIVIDELIKVAPGEGDPFRIIAIHFDISEYCSQTRIANFLYSLLCFGIIWDERSGRMYHLPEGARFRFFIELHTGLSDANKNMISTVPELMKVFWFLPIIGIEKEPLVDHEYNEEHTRIISTFWQLFQNKDLEKNMHSVGSVFKSIEAAFRTNGPIEPAATVFFQIQKFLSQKCDMIVCERPNYKNLFVHYLVTRCQDLRTYVTSLYRQLQQDPSRVRSKEPSAFTFSLLYELFLIESAILANQTDKDKLYTRPPLIVIRGKWYPSLDYVYFGKNMRRLPSKVRCLGDLIATSSDLLANDGSRLRAILQETFGIQQLNRILERRKYVLTPYFAFLLYFINERVNAKQPIILNGETGVGKTETLALYCDIINATFTYDIFFSIKSAISQALTEIPGYVAECPISQVSELSQVEKAVESITKLDRNACMKIVRSIFEEIKRKQREHPLLIPAWNNNKYIGSIFAANTWENFVADGINIDCKMVIQIIREYHSCTFEKLFVTIRMHKDYTADKLRSKVLSIVKKHEKHKEIFKNLPNAPKLVVLFDEINTTSVMGMVEYIVSDKRLDNIQLPEDICWICAMNPHKKRKSSKELERLNYSGLENENDRLVYLVEKVPESLQDCVFPVSNLTGASEVEFIQQLKMRAVYTQSKPEFSSLTQLISFSQEFVRKNPIHRITASIRDILRTIDLHNFFIKHPVFLGPPKPDTNEKNSRHWQSLIMAIGTNYFLRLPAEERKIFSDQFGREIGSLPLGEDHQCPQTLKGDLSQIMRNTMLHLYNNTSLPDGTACTNNLLENLWAMTVCTAATMPLVIVGPPGCSKTMSFHIATNKKRGEKNPEYYSNLPVLDPVTFQCSSQSTGIEIEKRYKETLQKQALHTQEANAKGLVEARAVLFLDEAGLSNDNALKILHYYMDHSQVSIILVSNQVIDAAKMNRGVQVFQTTTTNDVEQLAKQILKTDNALLVSKISNAYQITNETHPKMFNLRDFIFFLKKLHNSSFVNGELKLTSKNFLHALEHNFNGIERGKFRELVQIWTNKVNEALSKELALHINDSDYTPTIQLLRENCDIPGRFIMLIDPSEDNTAVSLLYKSTLCSMVDNKLYFNGKECVEVCIGDFAEDKSEEEITIAVKTVTEAMAEGKTVLFINSHLINGCFYELFNRCFREKPSDTPDKRQFVPVAVGSYSKECLVHEDFRVVMCISESQLPSMPGPFLNRFAKFRYSSQDVLDDIVATKNCQYLQSNAIAGDKLENKSFIELVLKTASNFIAILQKETSNLFYGIAAETVPSLIAESIRSEMSYTLHISRQKLSGSETYKQLTPLDTDRVIKLTKKAIWKLLNLARPEKLYFSYPFKQTHYLVREYFTNQEHFSAIRLIRKLLANHLVPNKSLDGKPKTPKNKWIIFTRTSAEFYQICETNFIYEHQTNAEVSCELIFIEKFRKSRWIEDKLRSINKTLVVLCIDMQLCRVPQVAHIKRIIDNISTQTNNKTLWILLLHFSPITLLTNHACYPVSYIQNWEYVYVDSLGLYTHSDTDTMIGTSSSLKEEIDGRSWIAKGFGLENPTLTTSSMIEFYKEIICEKIVSLLLTYEPSYQSTRQFTSILVDSNHTFFSSVLYYESDKRSTVLTNFANSEIYIFKAFIEYFCNSFTTDQLSKVIKKVSEKITYANSQQSFTNIVIATVNQLLGANISQFIELLLSNYQLEHAFYMYHCKSNPSSITTPPLKKVKQWEALYKRSISLLPPPPIKLANIYKNKDNASAYTTLSIIHKYNYITRIPMFPFIHSLLNEYCEIYILQMLDHRFHPENGLEHFYKNIENNLNLLNLVRELTQKGIMNSFLKDLITKQLQIPTESNRIKEKLENRPRRYFLVKLLSRVISQVVDTWIAERNPVYKQKDIAIREVYKILGYFVILRIHESRFMFMKDFLEKFNELPSNSSPNSEFVLFKKEEIRLDLLEIKDILLFFPTDPTADKKSDDEFVDYLHGRLLVPICWRCYYKILTQYSDNEKSGINESLLVIWHSIFTHFSARTEKSRNIFTILNGKENLEGKSAVVLHRYTRMFAFNLFLSSTLQIFPFVNQVLSNMQIRNVLTNESKDTTPYQQNSELASIFIYLSPLVLECSKEYSLVDGKAIVWGIINKVIHSLFSGRRIYQSTPHAFDVYSENVKFLLKLLNGSLPIESAAGIQMVQNLWLEKSDLQHSVTILNSVVNKCYSTYTMHFQPFTFKQNYLKIAEEVILAYHKEKGRDFYGDNITHYKYKRGKSSSSLSLEDILYHLFLHKYSTFQKSKLTQTNVPIIQTSIINIIKNKARLATQAKLHPTSPLDLVVVTLNNSSDSAMPDRKSVV